MLELIKLVYIICTIQTVPMPVAVFDCALYRLERILLMFGLMGAMSAANLVQFEERILSGEFA